MLRSRPVRTGVSLTYRGWCLAFAAVACAVGAYWFDLESLLFVAAMLAAVVTGGLLITMHRRPTLAVHRSFDPPYAMRGQAVLAVVEFENRSVRGVRAAVARDSWHYVTAVPDTTRSDTSDAVEVPTIRGRWSDVADGARIRWSFVPPHRGEVEMGPLLVTVGEPFGVASATVRAGGATRLVVGPDLVDMSGSALRLRHASGSAQHLDYRALGGEHEPTTRTYRSGDPLRHVHWRASAHHGELMVRQEEQRSAAEATVLLETRASSFGDGDFVGRQHFEHAVSLAASLAEYLEQQGFSVHVSETGRGPWGDTVLYEGFARVALVDAWDEGDLHASLTQPRHGAVYAVLGDLDGATVRELAAARTSFTDATAFVPEYVDEVFRSRLELAGWHCFIADRHPPIAAQAARS